MISTSNIRNTTSTKLIILVSIFLIVFENIAFFTNVLVVYPPGLKNSLFLLSLVIVLGCVNVILLSLLCYRYTIKPVLIVILITSSICAYYMDSYNVIINDVMIENISKTDINEILDLISFKMFSYLLLLGLLPSIIIFNVNLCEVGIKSSIFSKVKIVGYSSIIAVTLIILFGSFYASFIREHKPLRFYANPPYFIYSIGKYLGQSSETSQASIKRIGLDASIPASDDRRELIIFVVGETARADHFSLNGYHKKTNPYLEKEEVISFNNFISCGTTTAVSVPCMFSILPSSSFSKNEAKTSENVLDILQRAGVNVIWLDNNSDSKGVADRVPYESYKSVEKNTVCDIECRDIGMLENLQRYIDTHPLGDIFIVLHQMGNHGPSYYKRYPVEFEMFMPTCQTNQLEKCTNEEINNAYDNAILYTDYFLSKVIHLLKENNNLFESSLFYISDHGESLGEHNLYLHGMPNMLAPDSQTHVPMLMWFSDSFDKDEINIDLLRENAGNHYSHDNIFHTLLGLMEVDTNVYDKKMDLIRREEDG